MKMRASMLSLLGAAGLSVAAAQAEPLQTPSIAKVVASQDFSTLPALTALPRFDSRLLLQPQLPAHIARGSSAPDVVLKLQEYPGKRVIKSYRTLGVFESAEAAKAADWSAPPSNDHECFQVGMPQSQNDTTMMWTGQFARTTQFASMNKGFGKRHDSESTPLHVQGLMTEQLVSHDAASLELRTRVVLVDDETLGAKQVAEEQSRFAFFTSLPGGVRVYAQLGDGIARFVLLTPATSPDASALSVTTAEAGLGSSDGCPLVFTLRMGRGVTSSAVLRTDVVTELRTDTSGNRTPVLRGQLAHFSTSFFEADSEPTLAVSSRLLGRDVLGQPMLPAAP